MPEKINEQYYLNKALKIAKNDLKHLMRKWDIYLPTEKNLGRKPTITDHLKAKKLIEKGYNINTEITRRIKIESAIRDLNCTIYYKKIK